MCGGRAVWSVRGVQEVVAAEVVGTWRRRGCRSTGRRGVPSSVGRPGHEAVGDPGRAAGSAMGAVRSADCRDPHRVAEPTCALVVGHFRSRFRRCPRWFHGFTRSGVARVRRRTPCFGAEVRAAASAARCRRPRDPPSAIGRPCRGRSPKDPAGGCRRQSRAVGAFGPAGGIGSGDGRPATPDHGRSPGRCLLNRTPTSPPQVHRDDPV